MNSKTYAYSSTANGLLDRGKLRADLSGQGFGTSVNPITATASDFTVTTRAELTAEQWLIADSIVAAHEGQQPVFSENLRTWGIEKWTENVNVPSGSWTTAYTLTGPMVDFDACVFQLNSPLMRMRAMLDSLEMFDVLMSDMISVRANDADLLRGEGVWLTSHASNFWRFSPQPLHVSSSLKIEFQAVSGTRRIVRGFTQLLRHP